MPPPTPASSSRRLLQASDQRRIPGIPPPDPPGGVNSDVVVILAALLCALICVVGLAAVARCARSRRNNNAAANPSDNPADVAHAGGGNHPATEASATTVATSKGLKKRELKALPKLAYADAMAAAAAARGAVTGEGEGEGEKAEEVLTECAICLSEFGEREEVRVLPQCGHGFHVACVDTWLRSHSSCPSCRRAIVLDDPAPPKRCRKCEAMEAASSSSGGGFLP